MPERAGATGAVRGAAAIDNLRALVVLLVVAVHSVLAYLGSLGPKPFAFDKPPYNWRTFPIVDPHHFLGFDIYCAWANIFLMPLFFVVSGFFVWPSLERGGAARFVRRRALRLVPPFLVGVCLLMPIAIYAVYLQTAAHPGLADYWAHLRALPFWPDGPMWFLWVLLVFDALAAGIHRLLYRHREAVGRLSSYARHRPARFLAGLLALSALAYVPLGTMFGPMRWFQHGPFSFQLNFIGLYALYFSAGVVIGAAGLDNGLLAATAAGKWKPWIGAAAALFLVWLLISAKTFTDPSASTAWMLADAVALVPACLASCCCVLILTMRFGGVRTPALDSLQANALGIYLLHYPFVVWLQYAALALAWPALIKAPAVFASAVALSWGTAVLLRRLPIWNVIVGGGTVSPGPRASRPHGRAGETPALPGSSAIPP